MQLSWRRWTQTRKGFSVTVNFCGRACSLRRRKTGRIVLSHRNPPAMWRLRLPYMNEGWHWRHCAHWRNATSTCCIWWHHVGVRMLLRRSPNETATCGRPRRGDDRKTLRSARRQGTAVVRVYAWMSEDCDVLHVRRQQQMWQTSLVMCQLVTRRPHAL